MARAALLGLGAAALLVLCFALCAPGAQGLQSAFNKNIDLKKIEDVSTNVQAVVRRDVADREDRQPAAEDRPAAAGGSRPPRPAVCAAAPLERLTRVCSVLPLESLQEWNADEPEETDEWHEDTYEWKEKQKKGFQFDPDNPTESLKNYQPSGMQMVFCKLKKAYWKSKKESEELSGRWSGASPAALGRSRRISAHSRAALVVSATQP